MITKFTPRQINGIAVGPGIYKFYSEDNKLLYVGKAKNLKKRIANYFSRVKKDTKTLQLIQQIRSIRIIPVASEFEALLLESRLIRENQPKYNVIWKDDKHYIYIKITREKFPKILFARKRETADDYFGPFPSSRVVREILSYIRTIFPYCTQKASAPRACFYHHIGLCNPCPAKITKLERDKSQTLTRQYRQNIKNIKKILEGKITYIKKILQNEMHKFSEKEDFENAAIYRDKLSQLDYLVNRYTPAEIYIENPKFFDKLRLQEEKDLTDLLRAYFPGISRISRIECYDISNISGRLAAGSLVTFRNGYPDKNLYRRFRIRLKNTPDDFTMLKEIMSRRLKHTDWILPDLLVVDGGKPQIAATRKILSEVKPEIPIIGLAKRFEELVIPSGGQYIKVELPEGSPALNLVKRLRDEAHRFAHRYHSLLRIRNLFSTVEKS